MTDRIRVSEQISAEIKHIQKLENFESPELAIEMLITAYRELKELKSSLPNLTEEEENIVKNAVNLTGMLKSELYKTGLIAESKRLVSQAELQDRLTNVEPEKLKAMTFKGVAALRIERFITKIMEHNDNQAVNKLRYFISENLVADVSGSNRKAIKEFFEAKKLWIDVHNSKYNLTKNNNSKGKGLSREQILGF